VRREPRIPVLNGEPCYEGIMGGGWQEMQRFLFWTAITTGACGHTYGAQGMWAMSSRDEPFLGTTANWGDGYWQDVMHYAGSKQVALGRRFFEQYPWHVFEPMQEPLLAELKREYAFAMGIPGKIAVYYLPALCIDNKLQGMRGGAITIPPDADYSGYFFNPRTEARVEIGAVNPSASGRWSIPQCPSMEDWVLVLEDRKAL